MKNQLDGSMRAMAKGPERRRIACLRYRRQCAENILMFDKVFVGQKNYQTAIFKEFRLDEPLINLRI